MAILWNDYMSVDSPWIEGLCKVSNIIWWSYYWRQRPVESFLLHKRYFERM